MAQNVLGITIKPCNSDVLSSFFLLWAFILKRIVFHNLVNSCQFLRTHESWNYRIGLKHSRFFLLAREWGSIRLLRVFQIRNAELKQGMWIAFNSKMWLEKGNKQRIVPKTRNTKESSLFFDIRSQPLQMPSTLTTPYGLWKQTSSHPQINDSSIDWSRRSSVSYIL